MSDAPKVSIQTQAGHVNWLCNLADRLEPEATRRGLIKPKEAAMRVQYSGAVVATMRWLVEHHERIRTYLAHGAEIDALLALEPDVRLAVLRHGPTVAELAVQVAERERIAAEGGPVR